MRDLLRSLLEGSMAESELRRAMDFLTDALDSLRQEEHISNDAYLDAGAIQGGLGMVADMAALGVSEEELRDNLKDLIDRSERLCSVHPDLDAAIASKC